jgi:mannosyltransferase
LPGATVERATPTPSPCGYCGRSLGALTTDRRRLTDERAYAVVLAGVVLLGVLLRFPNLGSQSLWLDEALTHEHATSSFHAMLSSLGETESNPPLFYVLTWVIGHTAGAGDFWLRFLSACAGALLVVVVFQVTATVFDRRAGVYAAWLAAASPILVWYSQEARAYALAVLLTTVALLLFLHALRHSTARAVGGWVAVSVLAATAHYFAAIPFAVEAVLLWTRAPASRRRLAVALAVALPILVALAALANHQRAVTVPDQSIGMTPLVQRIAQVVKQFLVGYDGPWQAGLAIAAALLVGAFAAIPLIRRREIGDGVVELGIVGVATVALPVLGALAGADYFNTRNVLFALPVFVVLAGGGFARVRPRAAGVAAVAAVGLIGLTTTAFVAAMPIYQRPPWRSLAEAIAHGPRPAVIVVTPAHGILPLRAYDPDLRALTGPAAVRDVEAATIATKSGAGATAKLALTDALTPPSPEFKLRSRTRRETYAVVDLRADRPVELSPEAAAAARLTPGSAAVILVPAAK